MIRLASFLLFTTVITAIASGQEDELRPPHWTYADLASRSDLIVVAKAVSKTEIEWNDSIGGEFGKGLTRLMANRLRVLSALKGQSMHEIDVVTLEWKPDVGVLGAKFDFAELRTEFLLPNLVTVEMDGNITGYANGLFAEAGVIDTYKIEPEYLLYLRELDGNRYVPTTGQRYSAMSVRRLDTSR